MKVCKRIGATAGSSEDQHHSPEQVIITGESLDRIL